MVGSVPRRARSADDQSQAGFGPIWPSKDEFHRLALAGTGPSRSPIVDACPVLEKEDKLTRNACQSKVGATDGAG